MIDLEIYSKRIGISIEQIKSKSRCREIVTARQVYWFYLKSKEYSFSEIGRIFNMDHATIIYGTGRIKEFIDNNDSYVERYLNAIDFRR